MKDLYFYGMRLRGFSIGCQPKGVFRRYDDQHGKYNDIIAYERELTDDEVQHYSLDRIERPTNIKD